MVVAPLPPPNKVDLFGARLRSDPVEDVRLELSDVVEALEVVFELFTKLLPNEILCVGKYGTSVL